VGEIDDLRPGDAREEVLVAAREAHHLVGKDRPAHQDVVVLEHQAVQAHGHVQRQQSSRYSLDLALRDDPQGDQRLRVFPGMVEQVHVPVGASGLLGGNSHQALQAAFAEWGVGAQGNQEIKGLRPPGELPGHQAEKER
jgi:hypothetical protein